MTAPEILSKCTVEGNIIKLPPGIIDFKSYTAIKKHLEALGGKWNGGRVQGFVFDSDPSHLITKVDEIPAQTSMFNPPEVISEEKMEMPVEEKAPAEKKSRPSNYKKGGAIERAIEKMTEKDHAVFDPLPEQKCRVCGCTDNDCSNCIRITGKPCHWVEPNLCSACADAITQQQQYVKEKLSDRKCRKCGLAQQGQSVCVDESTGNEIHWAQPDLCSYCAEKMVSDQSPINNDEMNFFQQLAGIGNVDLTMRIMEKNGKLTMMIMPGAGSSNLKPMNFTGTPAELDAEFFSTITPGVNAVIGMLSNLDEVKQDIADQNDEKNKKAADKKPAAPLKKKTPPAKSKSKAPADKKVVEQEEPVIEEPAETE